MLVQELTEARGLLEPERTEGGIRRYSANDLERLRRIGDLLDAGLNLAGIGMVLDLEAENTQLRAEDQQWLKTARPSQAPDPEADLLQQQFLLVGKSTDPEGRGGDPRGESIATTKRVELCVPRWARAVMERRGMPRFRAGTDRRTNTEPSPPAGRQRRRRH